MAYDFEVLKGHVNQSGTLPRDLYTDPGVFAREVDAIFRREWLAVARSDDLAGPGDFATAELAGDPVLIVRGDDGVLRAFANVCLHRACPIAQGRGHAANGVLTCPYHRWTYTLAGRLKGTPLMDQAEGFDRTALGLTPLGVEEWCGFVFVNADADAAPLGPRVGSLTTLLAPYRLAEMVLYETLRFDSPWNWKVMVENFMESYHHMGTHPETLNASYPAAGTHWVDLEGDFTLLENPPGPGVQAEPFWVACVFPTLLLALVRGTPAHLVWYQMDIDTHDRFDLKIHLLATPELAADPDYRRSQAQLVRAIHLEDIPMCEGVWKGLNSRYHRDGRLSHLEAANWKFYDYLRRRLEG